MQAVLLDRYAFVITSTYDGIPAADPRLRDSLPSTTPRELSGDFTQGGRIEVAQRKTALSGWTVMTAMSKDEVAPTNRWLMPATMSLLLLACGLAVGLGFADRDRRSIGAS